MALRVHYFQHVPFEGLGSIRSWVALQGHALSRTEFFGDAETPELGAIDWLIIMGGPMGANEDDKYSWMKKEKEFIGQAIEAGKTVIGICLGAQLIASVLGSKVYPNPEKEIGWYPVTLTREATGHPLFVNFGDHPVVFHWHGDTFDLPRQAMRVAYSEVCKNQAFLYGDKVLGLQFHLEMELGSLGQMTRHGKGDLTKGAYIQSEDEILYHPKEMRESKTRLFALLDCFEK